MQISNVGKALLVGACILAGTAGWSQQKAAAPEVSTDIAATFAVEHSQVVPSKCCFWLMGGGADAAITFKNGLGAAVAFTGDHASNVTPGVDVNKITIMAGPRYTWTVPQSKSASQKNYQIFTQGLVGRVHGFNGAYPEMPALASTANAFAFQAGAGLNLLCHNNWGVRLLEADYVHSTLPNGSGNLQNDFRISFGVTWHH